MQLRDILEKIMKQKNWDQKELARSLGTTQQVISKILTGAPVVEKHFAVFLHLLALCNQLAIELPKSDIQQKQGSHARF